MIPCPERTGVRAESAWATEETRSSRFATEIRIRGRPRTGFTSAHLELQGRSIGGMHECPCSSPFAAMRRDSSPVRTLWLLRW